MGTTSVLKEFITPFKLVQSENSKEKKYKLTTNQLEGVIAKSLVDQEKQLKTALTPLLPLWPQN